MFKFSHFFGGLFVFRLSLPDSCVFIIQFCFGKIGHVVVRSPTSYDYTPGDKHIMLFLALEQIYDTMVSLADNVVIYEPKIVNIGTDKVRAITKIIKQALLTWFALSKNNRAKI